MMVYCRKIVVLLLLLFIQLAANAQDDSILVNSKGFIARYWQSLVKGNIDRTVEKKFDISFGIAPTYTNEGSFGIGGTMTGLYRLDRKDLSIPPSNVSIAGSASIKGFFVIEGKGLMYMPDNKGILTYNAGLSRKNLDFWGISSAACDINPAVKSTRNQFKIDADYTYRLTPLFCIGATLSANYTSLSKIDNDTYLQGQNKAYYMTGLGILMRLDSRDNLTYPHNGINLDLRVIAYPQILSTSKYGNIAMGMSFNAFHGLWKGGVLGYDIYFKYNSQDCPWIIREELGRPNGRMRGYYCGRYIDNCQITAQVELRQNIYKRLGTVIWGGAGKLFRGWNDMTLKNILPTYGCGLRFEFKQDMNLRLDVGFGRSSWGVSFGFSEAF